VLEREPEWVFPIVKNLSAQNVTTNSPVVASARGKERFTAGHEVVKVGNFPRTMSKTCFASLQNEK
jgi:hypothetical protein